MVKKEFIFNIKKILLMYFTGFSIAYALPNKYFFAIMNFYHKQLNDKLLVIDKDDYYSIN
jgi:hypothetical protein